MLGAICAGDYIRQLTDGALGLVVEYFCREIALLQNVFESLWDGRSVRKAHFTNALPQLK